MSVSYILFLCVKDLGINSAISVVQCTNAGMPVAKLCIYSLLLCHCCC